MILDAEFNSFEGSQESSACATYYNRHYPWSFELGDDSFGASLGAEALALANCNGVHLRASAEAKAAVFEQPLYLASTHVDAKALRSEISLSAGLLVLGYEVDRTELKTAGEISISGAPRLAFDESQKWRGAIGPVPVTVTYGVAGEAVLKWRSWANIMEAKISAVPHVGADAYVVGGVGSKKVAALMVQGELPILHDTLTAEVGIEIAGDDNAPAAVAKSHVKNSLSALNGRIFGVVKLLDKSVYEREFFNWDGIEEGRVIYDEVKHFPISF